MEELENGTQCRLSEKKIRVRIGLEKDKQPEDLRTLKLPGTIFEYFFKTIFLSSISEKRWDLV